MILQVLFSHKASATDEVRQLYPSLSLDEMENIFSVCTYLSRLYAFQRRLAKEKTAHYSENRACSLLF